MKRKSVKERDHEEEVAGWEQNAKKQGSPFPVLPWVYSIWSLARAGLPGSSSLPNLPSTRGRDWTVVTVVTMVPSGMMVRSSSIFLVGVMLGRGVEGVGVPRFPGEPSSYCSCQGVGGQGVRVSETAQPLCPPIHPPPPGISFSPLLPWWLLGPGLSLALG